jgi:GntR family transcriptional regulator
VQGPNMSTIVNSADLRPLYAQVRETLIERIKTGIWKPGQLLPNEFEVAAEFNVSQGTARKAIDTLAADGLVIRRQGKGTFVVEHTPANMLFRFFHVYDEAGKQALPDSASVRPRVVTGTADQCAALDLKDGASVIQIDRLRTCCGKPFSVETIALPDALFPGLARLEAVPNTLYDLFQSQFGVLVGRADDKITAVIASKLDAAMLGVREGHPLLQIDRTTYDLDGRPIEWRVSRCHMMDGMHYLARLK